MTWFSSAAIGSITRLTRSRAAQLRVLERDAAAAVRRPGRGPHRRNRRRRARRCGGPAPPRPARRSTAAVNRSRRAGRTSDRRVRVQAARVLVQARQRDGPPAHRPEQIAVADRIVIGVAQRERSSGPMLRLTPTTSANVFVVVGGRRRRRLRRRAPAAGHQDATRRRATRSRPHLQRCLDAHASRRIGLRRSATSPRARAPKSAAFVNSATMRSRLPRDLVLDRLR